MVKEQQMQTKNIIIIVGLAALTLIGVLFWYYSFNQTTITIICNPDGSITQSVSVNGKLVTSCKKGVE